MADDRPRGSCVIDGCPRDPYPHDDGHRPYVCGPDASRLRHWLREIPVLCRELQDKDAPEEVTVRADVRERVLARGGTGTVTVELVEVEALTVASALPAGSTPGAARGGRVSGSPNPRLPIDEDAVDLLAAARSLRRALGPDDIGFLPVASTLDFWVQDLRDHRARGEGIPEPSITVLAGWLLDRLDEACDDYPPIDEMFDHVRLAYGALRGQLGLIDVPQYMKGVPCPGCYRLTLLHKDGSEWIECADCPVLLTFDEYEEHVKSMSVEAVMERRRQVVEWRLFLRLRRELLAVGWRHTIEKQAVHGSDEVWTVHTWSRRDEDVQVWCMRGRRPDVRFNLADESEGWIGSAWIAANGGGTRLHKLASAAGVLSVPKDGAVR